MLLATPLATTPYSLMRRRRLASSGSSNSGGSNKSCRSIGSGERQAGWSGGERRSSHRKSLEDFDGEGVATSAAGGEGGEVSGAAAAVSLF